MSTYQENKGFNAFSKLHPTYDRLAEIEKRLSNLLMIIGSIAVVAYGVTINAVFPPLKSTDANYANYSYVLASPLVDGINPALYWSAVDKGPNAAGGQYQWSTFDSQIQRFIDAGKKVNIIVYAIDYGTPNTATPPYVLTDSLLDTIKCPSKSDWPVVYSPSFKVPYKAFIAEVIRHYANNSHIGYIRFGLSMGGEIFPWCGTQEATSAGLTYAQWGNQVWLPYDKEMLNFEKAQNPTMLILGPTTKGAAGWVDTEAAQAVANGFGFGNQGLEAMDITGYPKCGSGWCSPFDTYAGQVPMELQTIGQSDPTGVCGTTGNPTCPGGTNQQNTGPLPPLLAFGIQRHATIFEIYTLDLLLAFDPSYPNYALYHTEYVDAITNAHNAGTHTMNRIQTTALPGIGIREINGEFVFSGLMGRTTISVFTLSGRLVGSLTTDAAFATLKLNGNPGTNSFCYCITNGKGVRFGKFVRIDPAVSK
jgi:hypothetical protein